MNRATEKEGPGHGQGTVKDRVLTWREMRKDRADWRCISESLEFMHKEP